MKLAFNGITSGAGNNGGTRTILLCQKTLEELGHRCDFIAGIDNFTWFEHKKIINYLPQDLDALIAVACTDARHTLNIDFPNRAWYIRGHEGWSMSDQDLGYLYRDPRLFNIVNSKGLQHKLKEEFYADSVVVYQGVDIEQWSDLRLRGNKIRIGCLSNKRHKTKRWEDFVALAETLGHDNYEYVAFGLEHRDDEFLTGFLQSPSHEDLQRLYSSCHIWFAPSVLEGLSNVPMEAMLCGCLLVGNDCPTNGMLYDYLFAEKTGHVYVSDDVEDAACRIKNADWFLVEKGKKHIINNICDRKTNMKRLVNTLENF